MKKIYSHLKSLSFLILCSAGIIQSMEITPSQRTGRPLPSTPIVQNTPLISNDPIISIELNDIEDDLITKEWIEVINGITSTLKNLYHPNIDNQSIQQFSDAIRAQLTHNITAQTNFSIADLKKILKETFGIGHIYIIREKNDWNQIRSIVPSNSKNTASTVCYNGSSQQRVAHFYNPSQMTTKDLENNLDIKQKVSLKIFESNNGNIPIITAPSFTFFNPNTLLNTLTKMTKIIGRNYDNIILDLRGNLGGDIGISYYFLSLFLGNNDPDIYPLPLNNNDKLSYENLNLKLNNQSLPPFYELTSFGSINVTKNRSEDITFKKMVILVNEKTFSSGELVAANLKNTLGNKVCILGKPCSGSLEEGNNSPIPLPHDFKLHLSAESLIFYSKKFAKLLTGCRLLPDIRHNNMDTIKEKALEILYKSTAFSATPSYERTISTTNHNG